MKGLSNLESYILSILHDAKGSPRAVLTLHGYADQNTICSECDGAMTELCDCGLIARTEGGYKITALGEELSQRQPLKLVLATVSKPGSCRWACLPPRRTSQSAWLAATWIRTAAKSQANRALHK
jgi:hypothetical protein